MGCYCISTNHWLELFKHFLRKFYCLVLRLTLGGTEIFTTGADLEILTVLDHKNWTLNEGIY
jgi:hypothetical protein